MRHLVTTRKASQPRRAGSFLFGALLLIAAIAPLTASPVSGNLAVFSGSTLLGYVSDAYDGQNSFTYTTSLSDALTVEFDTSDSVFSLLMQPPPGSLSNAYFGAVGGFSGYQLGAGQADYTYLSGSSSTAAGSTPSSSATNDIQPLGYYGPSETTIWTRIGDMLQPNWVNPDGTVAADQVLYYDPVVDYLGITADLTTFNDDFGEDAEAVTLEFTGAIPTPEPGSLGLLGLALGIGGLIRLLRPIIVSRRHLVR